MNATNTNPESFNESQSLQVIKEMIEISRKKLNNNGTIILAWGYAWFISNMCSYLNQTLFITDPLHKVFNLTGKILPFVALIYTIYYIIQKRRKATTYINISLRYIWITLFFSLVLINLILFNVLRGSNFTLQHPVFMVNLAFAIVVTGIILQHRFVVIGGIIFGGLAYLSSYLALRDQLLLEAIAWFFAFVIPGHIMFYNRNK